VPRDERLDNDPDFILSSKHSNSLKELLRTNPHGVSDETISRVMDLSPEEVEATWQAALVKLRGAMGNIEGEDNE
jgi:DNA-directed RNA polymerase specialized sigma24 family protein